MSEGEGRRWLETEARAKVNLRLLIFPPMVDGYHPIETIFCRIDLADTVRLATRETPGVALDLHGDAGVPAGPANLAVRAAEGFISEFGVEGGVEIELRKTIPAGSGLGGGSADAAAVLRLLARATGRGDRGKLLDLAGELGSDVPFFVSEWPLALAWGRGDRLLALPRVGPRPMLLVCPREGISTRAAYSRWDRLQPGHGRHPPGIMGPQDLGSWEAVERLAINDFESVVFDMSPQLSKLKDHLLDTRPAAALLSGSGSTLFAIYRGRDERDAAADWLRDRIGDADLFTTSGPV